MEAALQGAGLTRNSWGEIIWRSASVNDIPQRRVELIAAVPVYGILVARYGRG